MVKDIVKTLAEAGYPYLQCELIQGRFNTLHSEIRVGGQDCHDGFLSDVKSTLGNERWTGHFYRVKFTLSEENTLWLIRNAYDVAYRHGFQGRRIGDDEVAALR